MQISPPIWETTLINSRFFFLLVPLGFGPLHNAVHKALFKHILEPELMGPSPPCTFTLWLTQALYKAVLSAPPLQCYLCGFRAQLTFPVFSYFFLRSLRLQHPQQNKWVLHWIHYLLPHIADPGLADLYEHLQLFLLAKTTCLDGAFFPCVSIHRRSRLSQALFRRPLGLRGASVFNYFQIP